MAKPLVATALAVEGLGLVPERHFLRAETPDEWCAQIARLEAAAREFEEAARGVQFDPVADADLIAVLPLLDRARALPFGPDYVVPAEWFPALQRTFMKNRLATMTSYIENLGRLRDWTAELDAIACPTLLLVGDADTPCRAPMARMAREIGGATFQVIPRCGHSSAVEKAEDFNRLMLERLKR